MAHPKYLLQEVEGQKPYVYLWTPVLAKKKGMRPITPKEAAPYLKKQQGITDEDDQIPKGLSAEDMPTPEEMLIDILPDEAFVSEDDEDQAILAELESNAPKTSPIDGKAKKLEVTQDDLLEKDMEKINKLQEKPSIEEYMLKKYKVPMLAMETIDEMRQQAKDILGSLAARESLH